MFAWVFTHWFLRKPSCATPGIQRQAPRLRFCHPGLGLDRWLLEWNRWISCNPPENRVPQIRSWRGRDTRCRVLERSRSSEGSGINYWHLSSLRTHSDWRVSQSVLRYKQRWNLDWLSCQCKYPPMYENHNSQCIWSYLSGFYGLCQANGE